MEIGAWAAIIILVVFILVLLMIKPNSNRKTKYISGLKEGRRSREIEAYSLTSKGEMRFRMLDDTPKDRPQTYYGIALAMR